MVAGINYIPAGAKALPCERALALVLGVYASDASAGLCRLTLHVHG